MWYDIKNFSKTGPEEISLEVQVPPDSNWFSGHFPGEPILPGIAQLGMVFDAINRAEGGSFKITGIRRVRFKQIVRPDDRLHLTIRPQKNGGGGYDFRIEVNAELACSGIMTVAPRP
ncbi:MAG: hypothetical protein AB1427_10665 [Thermodesulfobacteriota bacterium]